MSCQVIIESSTGNFFPGGSVQGKVQCFFRGGDKTRGIRIKIRGREHTAWTKRESYYDSTSKSTKYRTVHYSGDNKFLQAQITLANEGTFSPGKFEYPFHFTLPTHCPGTFNTSHGNIRYYLKANVDIPWAPDYESEVTFIVVAPIDFNTMSGLMLNPVQYQDEKDLCCCCCANGPITMDVHLDKEAFVLGEAMRIRVNIVNMSNESLQALNIKLKMTIKEMVTSPSHDSKYSEELIASLRDTGVGAHGDRDYDLSLVIPNNIVLPNFNGCSLFEMWCVLKIEAEIPGCHSDLDIETGIQLGHVPLVTHGMTQPVYVDGATYPAAPPAPINDAAPPYPGGPSDFPQPQVPPYDTKEIPGVHMPMPMPMPSGPPYPPGANGLPPYPPGANGLPPYPPEKSSAPYPPGGPMPSYPPEKSAAPYPPGGPMPPYPPGPSSSPYPPGPSANAPPESEAPSAPPKMPLGGGDDFEVIDADGGSGQPSSREPPPPSYFDALDSKPRPPPPGPK